LFQCTATIQKSRQERIPLLSPADTVKSVPGRPIPIVPHWPQVL
jgi:hypothetical protein